MPVPAGTARPLALAVTLAVVAYANALGNSFALDDIGIIVENPVIRNAGDVGTIFTTGYWPSGASGASADPTLYRPLTILSYAVDFALFNLNAAAYHAVNVALHAVTTGLVYVLAFGLLGSVAAALATASVFAVHPMHTEAVAGIVGRADILAALFFVLAFLILRQRAAFRDGAPAIARGVGAAMLWLLGLFSKEMAATLPAVLALDDWLHRSEFPADRGSAIRVLATRYVPLGIAALLWLALRGNAIGGGSQIWPGFMDVSTLGRVLTASRVMLEYIGLFVFPRQLLADYWTTEVPVATSLADRRVLLSLALWVGVAVLLFRSSRRRSRLVLPIAWFFVTLAPVSNILFPIGVAKAERLTYLPSVGLCLLVGWAYASAEQRFQPRMASRLALAALLAVFILRTARRNQDWKDSLTLALATLEDSPSSPLMNDVAAGELVRRGDARGALPLLQEAVRQAPYMAFARTHLGTAYSHLGMHDQAMAEYREALRLNPSDADAHNNLGVALMISAREEEAIEQFRAAIAIRPGFADPRMNLGVLLLGRGRLEEALAELSEAVRLNPGSADGHNNLGLVLSRTGQGARAATEFREALRLNPGHVKARENLAALEQGRPPGT